MVNYDEDTEFNAALRARGIIPQKPKEDKPEDPVYSIVDGSRELSDVTDLDDLDDLDDDLPRELLERYRSSRLDEINLKQRRQKYGRIYPISKVDYTREITEASQEQIEQLDPKIRGTGVVCYLYKDHILECNLLRPLLSRLAQQYPCTKFCSIVADKCIENYPESSCPTLLVYRDGKVTGQIVGLSTMGGKRVTLADVEKVLTHYKALDSELKLTSKANADSDSEDDSDRGNGIRRAPHANDEDSDLDL